jgi:hypothetical protein
MNMMHRACMQKLGVLHRNSTSSVSSRDFNWQGKAAVGSQVGAASLASCCRCYQVEHAALRALLCSFAYLQKGVRLPSLLGQTHD